MFEVGKKVIAIKTHSQGMYIKGQLFTLQGIKNGCCGLWLDIGMDYPIDFNGMTCVRCGKIHMESSTYFAASAFAPYDDSLSSITVEELLEEVEGTAEVLL